MDDTSWDDIAGYFVVGLIIFAIAIGTATNAVVGWCVLGGGVMLISLIMAMVKYLQPTKRKCNGKNCNCR